MEWIKAKYDRLLLGICGAVALIVGALLLMNALGWKKKFAKPAESGKELSDFGDDDAGKLVDQALTRLKSPAMVKPPVHNSVPVPLFTSLPVLKVAGDPELINILDPKAKLVRPPISNVWLYNNDLNIRQVNIGDEDTDGDKFTNVEEFMADPKTNPRDPASHPPVYAKVQYTQLIEDPLSIKLQTFSSPPPEVTFRITTATPETSYTTKYIGAGAKILDAKNGQERFVIVKIDATVTDGEFAILDDLKTGQKGIKAELRKDLPFPSYRARLVCTLGKEEEKVVMKGESVTFEADPDANYKVLDVTPEQVSIEYTPKGGTPTPIVIKIQPPP